ncbi:MAG: hypothetical protein NT138_21760 [Planctomycetales bacterium]|nr:hypothetical protein [Planctomycetales bacterium]
MHTRRFQILTSLQVALQLLTPAIAPWLHSFVECGGVQHCTSTLESHAPSASPTQRPLARCLPGCCHDHGNDIAGSATHSSDQNQPDQQTPHDCAHCAICQAIAAPRILASVVELSAAPEQIVPLVVPACADPMLGFGLPPKCRAPPAA